MWLASDLQVDRAGKAEQNDNKTKNLNSGDLKSLESAYAGKFTQKTKDIRSRSS